MTLTLLDRAVHDFEHLGTVALDCAASRAQSDKRGTLTGENGILTAVDSVHKVLDRGRAQADETVVLGHTCLARQLVRQIQCEAKIADLIVFDPHLFEKVHLLAPC